MKAEIPALKKIPGIPRNFAEEIQEMSYEELVALAGFNPAQAKIVAPLTDTQLQGIVDGTPEGLQLMAELEALENEQ